MNQGAPFAFGQRIAVRRGFVVGIAMQQGASAQCFYRADLDSRRGGWHYDQRIDAEFAGTQRHALGMIAGGNRDHAASPALAAELAEPVIGAAQLEGKHRLQVFPFQPNCIG